LKEEENLQMLGEMRGLEKHLKVIETQNKELE